MEERSSTGARPEFGPIPEWDNQLGQKKIIVLWRAKALWCLAWCLGISNHVVIHAARDSNE